MYFIRMSHYMSISCFLASVISFAYMITLMNAGGAEGLAINPVTTDVPLVIKNGSESKVVLDCEYALSQEDYELNEKTPGSLVVKWFFNNNPAPVYQWIHSKKPQDLGVLKGKLNLDYQISQDESTKHRALQIVNPTTELSGEYKCTVSTFAVEMSQTKRVIIYVPAKSLEVTQTKLNGDKAVNITCKAEGVFPKPELMIRSEDSSAKHKPYLQTFTRNGLYDAVASLVVDDSDLKDTTTKFDCELKIPETDYSALKTVVYTPANNAHYSRSLVTWILPLVLLLCLRL